MKLARTLSNRPCASFFHFIQLCNISSHQTDHITERIPLFLTLQNAEKSFDLMLRTRPLPPVSSFNNLLDLFNGNKKYKVVVSMHDRMVKVDIVPDFVTLNIVLHGFCCLQDRPNVSGLGFVVFGGMLKRGYTPNILSYTSLIKGLFVAGKVAGTRELFQKIINLEIVTYATLVEGLCRTGNTRIALWLHHENNGKNHDDVSVYNALVYGLCREGRVDEAEKMFVSMEKGDVVSYILLIKGYCKSGKTDKAIALYRGMIRRGVESDPNTYNIIIQCLSENKEWEKAKCFINEMMGNALDLSQPKAETNLPDGVLAVPLLRHQRIALSWMVQKETASLHCSGGILADDPGLGKTLSTIALIIKERSPNAGTLVVCPTSVLHQWANEFCNKVTREANISVLVYHGANRTKDLSELAKYDVVITTYSIVKNEVPKDDKSVALPLARVGWFRVVLDEAQKIKNHKTQVARACCGLRAKRRWCLSGTPIQNDIDDLYSYFKFLRYDQYATYKSFCSSLKDPIYTNQIYGYKKLQAVLKTVMLRRMKGTLLDGEPIVKLPPKSVELKKLDFTKKERDFYRRLETDSKARFSEYAAAGTIKHNYFNILEMLTRLRQACDHPLLVGGYNSSPTSRSYVEVANKFSVEKRVALLSCLEASLAICGVCNDPPEDAVVTSCGHVFCIQCIREHLSDNDEFCPVTNCKNRLSASSLFSKASLNCSLAHEPGSEVSDRIASSSCGTPFLSSKIKAVLKVLESISNKKTITDDYKDIDLGRGSKESDKVEKTLVFSQWIGMLDLLEPFLESSSIQYRRLDGTMSVLERDKAMEDFKSLPEVSVMIMSLKASGVGINMVEARHVILCDLWWNPSVEDQAVDRAHRIGQTHPVSVTRITIKNTVEDRILALQQKKRAMVASVFGNDQMASNKIGLTEEDLKYLFMAEFNEGNTLG